ncbi:uncharacterized protein LOC142494549 [Ascaphus truei]|uniref:uncharacterized protein LOC142494549 n=1 Tax=Ascaphus truei TaxID=8439 RepID=UPI003F5A2263
MGSNMAPSYANLFMSQYEQTHILYDSPYANNIRTYMRYIDDLFLIWDGSEADLLQFLEYLNSIPSNIRFTLNYSNEQIVFLDTVVYKGPTRLLTKIHHKATDRNTLLLASSHHPDALKKGLPYSQFLRVLRITSRSDECEEALQCMTHRFLARGYNHKEVKEALAKARRFSRDQLLKPTIQTSTSDRFGINTTFSTSSCTIRRSITKHWHILENDKRIGKTFTKPPLFCYRRGRNIGDLLTQADPVSKYASPTNWLSKTPGVHKCHGCINCQHMILGKSFVHPHSGKAIKIKDYMNCESKFVVYIIRCPCDLYYIGKTTRMLKERMSLHRSSIRKALLDSTNNEDLKLQPVARHFKDHKHSLATLRCMPIMQAHAGPRGGDRGKLLLQLETRMIFELNTMAPRGLNEDFKLGCFL